MLTPGAASTAAVGGRRGRARIRRGALVVSVVALALPFGHAVAKADQTGLRNPVSNAATSGGDGNGFEIAPSLAHADGGGAASNVDGAGDRHLFATYGMGLVVPTGIEVRVDWWLSSTSGTNSLCAELSWNGGTSWTTQKCDTFEDTAEHTGTLGGPTDTWGRTWVAGDLDNDNLRLRLTSNCTGIGCSSQDYFLDWVAMDVTYVASPTTTGDRSPTANQADTGGDGDGFEVSAANAHADGGGRADNNNGAGDRHRYYNFGLTAPSGTVNGITVRVDWWLDSRSGTNSLCAELSWNGGTSWTTQKCDAFEDTAEHTGTLGGPTDTWGRQWNPNGGELSDANFRVRLTANSTSGSRDFRLDWVAVAVSYDSTFFNEPRGLAVDASGNVYIADTFNDRVEKFSGAGLPMLSFGSYGTGDGQFKESYGVVVDPSNSNIYVVDVFNHRIQQFDGAGNFVRKWGGFGTADGFFNGPRGVARSSTGDIYVTDMSNDRVQRFSSTGAWEKTWGGSGTGNGQFDDPVGIAVDALDNVYVGDWQNCRIQKFDADGNYITQWGQCGSGNGDFNTPRGIAVNSAGSVFVCDAYNHRVQEFSSDGAYLAQWGELGAGDGQFDTPRSIGIDSSGNFFVADTSNYRVQKFNSSKAFVQKWGSFGFA